MATDQDKVIDAAISTLIDHAEGSYRGDLGDIEQEIDDYLAALRRDRETLRKIREVVNRPTVSQDNLSVYAMWCTALFEVIQRLVREEQEKGDA